jgi:hypothetical protein
LLDPSLHLEPLAFATAPAVTEAIHSECSADGFSRRSCLRYLLQLTVTGVPSSSAIGHLRSRNTCSNLPSLRTRYIIYASTCTISTLLSSISLYLKTVQKFNTFEENLRHGKISRTQKCTRRFEITRRNPRLFRTVCLIGNISVTPRPPDHALRHPSRSTSQSALRDVTSKPSHTPLTPYLSLCHYKSIALFSYSQHEPRLLFP